ncbi:class A beta-lactamase [Aestuariispira ectoiniformans]|uniref:class A beta-lactamase n=1 Tax=Aestuariispira ectoiniformans TaxID=2775080 RepID=UPI00223B06B6|nr:class A beta-lactamase [Aestuariispira ectoiniformans]
MKRTTRKLAHLAILGSAFFLTGLSAGQAQELNAAAAKWEDKLDARIGVELREISSGWALEHRADERFPMSSTFKVLLCGAVLARVDASEEDLTRRITYTKGDLVTYSPVTKEHVEDGMTIGELCEATLTTSDNTAGNLLLNSIGGPKGLTAFLRSIGDDTTRLDRWETALNESTPGDERDTTTPAAMVKTLNTLLFADVLRPESSARLRGWMIDDKVADALIRANLPDGWVIGDKTGAGGHGSRGITAFLQDENGRTYLAAIYLTDSKADFPLRNKVVAEIGKAMIDEIAAR